MNNDAHDIGKSLAHSAGELTDTEISNMFRIVEQIRLRYAGKPNTPDNLEHLRDEVLTKLMDIGIIATLDPAPCFYGDPPTLEIVGKVSTEYQQHGLDHEKKAWEVRKAVERKEDWLGQKEKIDKPRDK